MLKIGIFTLKFYINISHALILLILMIRWCKFE